MLGARVGTVFNLAPANACWAALFPIWVKTMKLALLTFLLLLVCQVSSSAQVRTDSTDADILEAVYFGTRSLTAVSLAPGHTS